MKMIYNMSQSRQCFKNKIAPNSLRVIGIDPGVGRTGYGVIEEQGGRVKCITYGCISTPKTLPLHKRLQILAKAIRKLLKTYPSSAVGVETIIFSKNVTTGIAVSEARGVLLYIIAEANMPIIELTPLQVKQALTTYGRADKSQVLFMVRKLLNMKTIPRPDDAADALAIALAAAQMRKMASL